MCEVFAVQCWKILNVRSHSRHSNMNQGNRICFFLMLFCIGMSTQVPLESKGHSGSYLKSSELQERGQTSLKLRISTVEPTERNEHLSPDGFQLCVLKTSRQGKITRCNDENPLPLCLNKLVGNVTTCHDTPLLLRKPLCVKQFLNLLHVVSCTDNSPHHLCYASVAKPRRLEFCNRPAAAVCLETRGHEFRLCNAPRVKREEVQEPELDMDGYYLKCEDCDLKVVMKADEEKNEQPVIEISSVPRKKSNKAGSTTKESTTKASGKTGSTTKKSTTKASG